MNRLLSLLCGTHLMPEQVEALRQACATVSDWGALLQQASQHRLLPLAYWHVRQHAIACPPAVMRTLAGAYLRHKSLAQAQARALGEIAEVLDTARIDFVVLKGGALAHLIYPEPGLRPMDDLDLLVAPEQAPRVRLLLQSLGFEAPAPLSRYARLQHHLPLAQRDYLGHPVGVEVHTAVFNLIMDQPLTHAELQQPLTEFSLAGRRLRCMNPAQLLWMQYRGLRKLAEPLSYIHLCDLAGLVEQFAAQIDGAALCAAAPDLWHALLALDEFRPLDEPARRQLGLPPYRPGSLSPGTGADYLAWPRPLVPGAGRAARAWQLLWPPRWWGRFFYGVADGPWARGQISARHAALYLNQGLRRLYLGPVGTQGFFKPRSPASPIPVLAPASAEPASAAPPEPVRAPAASLSPPQFRTGLNGGTAFVTCIYNGLAGSKFGGRLNRDESYRDSLRTIAGCGVPIFCFVPCAELELHRAAFASQGAQIELIPLELEEVPCSARVQAIKARHPQDFEGLAWQERCVEIMWGKFHFLRQVLARQPGLAHVYWIDAGLANVNIISTRYISEQALHEGRLCAVHAAFTPALVEALSRFAGDRVLALESTVPHNPGIPEQYNQRPYANANALIAGLFGGRREALRQLCDRFEEKAERLLAEERLFFEESIMTGVRADLPELFNTFVFDSWYHEGWTAHEPGKRHFSQFFDQLLATPAPAVALRLPWCA